MLKVFRTSFSLKNTYRANSIIYAIRQIPFIGKRLPVRLYGSETIKTVANIVAVMWELMNAFLGKALYFGLMILLPGVLYNNENYATSLHIFVCLTITGTYLNTYMFNPSNDKYYAIVLMRMEGRTYAISNYMYQVIKCLVGFYPCVLILGGLISNIPLWICMLMPIYVSGMKVIATYLMLRHYVKTGIVCNENVPQKISWIFTVGLIAAAYGLPAAGIGVTAGLFGMIMVLVIPATIWAVVYIWKFEGYTKVYKKLLADKQVGMSEATLKAVREQSQKYITYDPNDSSNKKGFEYFNQLFINRHKKILWKSAFRIAVIAVIIIMGTCAILIANTESRAFFNEMVMMSLPFFVFVMYAINRGTIFTQALFMNCDHAMLSYSFYKKPEFILALFKIRLREITKVNLLPATVLALGLSLILLLSGGTDNNWNYLIIFIAFGVMSVFFSVHYLTCYYLLQPYNSKTEVKGVQYHIVTGVTYVVCYMAMRVRMNTFVFGIAISVFCVLYSILACVLIYKFANKTFRIRQ